MRPCARVSLLETAPELQRTTKAHVSSARPTVSRVANATHPRCAATQGTGGIRRAGPSSPSLSPPSGAILSPGPLHAETRYPCAASPGQPPPPNLEPGLPVLSAQRNGTERDGTGRDGMGCSTSSHTSAVDTSRPGAKPEESNGASATGDAGSLTLAFNAMGMFVRYVGKY